MENQIVSLQQMKEALSRAVGSKFPVKLTLKDGEEMIRYIRGYADQQSNIVLVSEISYSLALKIIEVQDIKTMEFSPGGSEDTWKVLHARWLKKKNRPLPLFFSLLSVLLHPACSLLISDIS